jgi:hypothetical protein
MARVTLAVFALFASALPALAQIPLGPEFRVDTLGADQGFIFDRPRNVSMAPDGHFTVAWITREPVPVGRDIAARRFDSAGMARGPDFLVNSYTPGQQQNESIASDDAGNFVIVWDGPGPYGYLSVFGQRFDASGARVGNEFRVNATTATYAVQPFVAMRPAGEFDVVWRAGGNVLARRYDAAGLPATGEFQVNTYTTGTVDGPSLDFDGAGNFVVVWGHPDGYPSPGVRGQLFTAAGTPQGSEFQINAGTSGTSIPRVARSQDGSFVVAWYVWQDRAVAARRFDPTGAPVGAEVVVGPMMGSFFYRSLDVDADADGDFVAVWEHQYQILGRRFASSGSPGPQFQVSTYLNGNIRASVASDPAGNFVVVWRATPSYPTVGVFARRYAAGLMAAALAVDGSAGPTSDGNGVFEAGETATVAPSWLNANVGAQAFSGTTTSFTGPGAPGDPAYTIADGAASYGTVASGATGSCTGATDCYSLGVTIPSTRPAVHWDASFHEDISPANLGATKNWTLHIGESFGDVPRTSGFYRFAETLLHHGITGGCNATQYCPPSSSAREQMAVFVLVAKDGPGNPPPACTTPVFGDVPASSPYCRWIEELARRGVVAGCGGGNYCPSAAVSREQMAVFTLLTKEPGVTPSACGTPMFSDVPASSPFCRWIEELARRNVVTGCGGSNYCPAAAVTREQMAVFISAGFGLTLYGP